MQSSEGVIMETCGNTRKYLFFELAWPVCAHTYLSCMWVYMLTSVWLHMGMWESLCGGHKLALGVLCWSLLFLKQGLSLSLGSALWERRLASELWGSAFSFPTLGFWGYSIVMPGFYRYAKNPNLGAYPCVTSTFLVGPLRP